MGLRKNRFRKVPLTPLCQEILLHSLPKQTVIHYSLARSKRASCHCVACKLRLIGRANHRYGTVRECCRRNQGMSKQVYPFFHCPIEGLAKTGAVAVPGAQY
jgi:hypothetical protein